MIFPCQKYLKIIFLSDFLNNTIFCIVILPPRVTAVAPWCATMEPALNCVVWRHGVLLGVSPPSPLSTPVSTTPTLEWTWRIGSAPLLLEAVVAKRRKRYMWTLLLLLFQWNNEIFVHVLVFAIYWKSEINCWINFMFVIHVVDLHSKYTKYITFTVRQLDCHFNLVTF